MNVIIAEFQTLWREFKEAAYELTTDVIAGILLGVWYALNAVVWIFLLFVALTVLILGIKLAFWLIGLAWS